MVSRILGVPESYIDAWMGWHGRIDALRSYACGHWCRGYVSWCCVCLDKEEKCAICIIAPRSDHV